MVGLFLVGDLTAGEAKHATETGVRIGGVGALKQISGKSLAAINKIVGFRLFTKYGSTGWLNIFKAIHILSIAVGAAVDGGFCLATANAVETLTFRGQTRNQRCLSDALDNAFAPSLKRILIKDLELDAATFCDGYNLVILKASMTKDEFDTYMKVFPLICKDGGKIVCEHSLFGI